MISLAHELFMSECVAAILAELLCSLVLCRQILLLALRCVSTNPNSSVVTLIDC